MGMWLAIYLIIIATAAVTAAAIATTATVSVSIDYSYHFLHSAVSTHWPWSIQSTNSCASFLLMVYTLYNQPIAVHHSY